MKFGQRLLLTMLALLTLAMASHQAVASMEIMSPCAEAFHASSDDQADPAHCATCCQLAQAMSLLAEAAVFHPVSLSVKEGFARYTDTALGPIYRPFKPPRFV